jgi:hypothetical protein
MVSAAARTNQVTTTFLQINQAGAAMVEFIVGATFFLVLLYLQRGRWEVSDVRHVTDLAK